VGVGVGVGVGAGVGVGWAPAALKAATCITQPPELIDAVAV
jgi:hypothetical protein